jgi:hypothetical protein
MKLIYLILLTITIYYLLKALIRLVRMFFVSSSPGSNDSSEKDVRIEGKPSRFRARKKETGEYVDYEEIK